MNDDWLDDFLIGSEEDETRGCLCSLGYIIIFWLLVGLCILCSSCKSVEYIPVIEHKTDTLIITKHQRDSILVKDSTNVSETQQGDTVYIKVTRWRTEYHDRAVHDTLYMSKTDSISKPYPVTKYVEKELNWWQKTRLHLGDVLLIAIGFAIIYAIFRLKRHWLP